MERVNPSTRLPVLSVWQSGERLIEDRNEPRGKRMNRFEYMEAKSVGEALSQLSQYGDRAKMFAGGTNLLPEMKLGRMKPDCLINIKRIQDLGKAYEDKEGLHLGALVTLAELSSVELSRRKMVSPSLLEKVPFWFRKIISLMGNPQMRNIATVAGNLAWGSPAADTAPPLLALGARLKISGISGERVLPVEELFLGPKKTALKVNEMITEIVIPAESLGRQGMALKFMKRKANTLAVCSAAATVNAGENGRIKGARIAVGAVAPTPMRLKKVEALLEGQTMNGKLMKEMKRLVGEEIHPVSDGRSTAWFRREITPVLVERCLLHCVR